MASSLRHRFTVVVLALRILIYLPWASQTRSTTFKTRLKRPSHEGVVIVLSAEESVRASKLRAAFLRIQQVTPFRLNCLVLALVAERLALDMGLPVRVSIGVQGGGGVKSHAWVDSGGIRLVGGWVPPSFQVIWNQVSTPVRS